LRKLNLALAGLSTLLAAPAASPADAPVKTTGGLVQGTTTTDGSIRVYKGIPFAAAPVGELRWQAPKPALPWPGVRDAKEFGARCVQGQIFSDIVFTNKSEDCLNLNVWTPARGPDERLPVMVWIHGGGFQAGSGAENRHDGEAFARKGVVIVTINYRLGVFGFFAHPELTRESGRNASGNYGLLDQVAALEWVRDNAAAFGGDAKNVTIFGESAGSFAVSALMASPLAQGLFHKAIGESGAYFPLGAGALPLRPLAEAEAQGTKFQQALGAASLADLRAKPAEEVLQAAMKAQPWFAPDLDGHFLTAAVQPTFAAGKQAQVPLLAGWNADETRAGVVLAKEKPNATTFPADVRKRFGAHADAVLKVYPAANDAEALESAASLASDGFIGFSTWRWIEAHRATATAPVYRYSFDRKIPVEPGNAVNGTPATSKDVGARHAGEIEYVFGTLALSLPKVPWEEGDRSLSDAMTSYWSNFAKTGDPNGKGLPRWPVYGKGDPVLHLDLTIKDAPDALRARYEALDAFAREPRAQ
jgi:para-nitrobenzyl esterase